MKTKSILNKSNNLKKKGKFKEILKVLQKKLVKDSTSEDEELACDKSSVYNCDERINHSSEMRNSLEINGQVKECKVENSPKDKVEDNSYYCNTKKGRSFC